MLRPGIVGMRGTTTAMHKLSTPPPPLASQKHSRRVATDRATPNHPPAYPPTYSYTHPLARSGNKSAPCSPLSAPSFGVSTILAYISIGRPIRMNAPDAVGYNSRVTLRQRQNTERTHTSTAKHKANSKANKRNQQKTTKNPFCFIQNHPK